MHAHFYLLSSGARVLNVGLAISFHFLYIRVSEQRGWRFRQKEVGRWVGR